jgi:hypothetical protein
MSVVLPSERDVGASRLGACRPTRRKGATTLVPPPLRLPSTSSAGRQGRPCRNTPPVFGFIKRTYPRSAAREGRVPKTALRLPDLDQAKLRVLNSLSWNRCSMRPPARIGEFIEWYLLGAAREHGARRSGPGSILKKFHFDRQSRALCMPVLAMCYPPSAPSRSCPAARSPSSMAVT